MRGVIPQRAQITDTQRGAPNKCHCVQTACARKGWPTCLIKGLITKGFDTPQTSGGTAHSSPSRLSRATDLQGTWSWRVHLRGLFNTRFTRDEPAPLRACLVRWSTSSVAIISVIISRCRCLSELTGGAGTGRSLSLRFAWGFPLAEGSNQAR